MRVLLVHNPKAGGAASLRELRAALGAVGWKVVAERQRDEPFAPHVDVVVVAGGDGTVAMVAKRLANTGMPMAIVPMGTANNIARSLGIGVDPVAAVRGLERPTERAVDLGMVSIGQETEYFLEGFGVGVFANVMAERASGKDKKLHRARSLLADELDEYAARHLHVEIDGCDVSGAYVLAAVMNAQSLGPALGIAPQAKVDDGELDVVLVPPAAKEALVVNLRRAARAGDLALPALDTARARHVRLRADGRWIHIDDAPRELNGCATIDVASGAVRLLAPSHRRR